MFNHWNYGVVGSYLAEHILKKDKNIKIDGFYRSKGYKTFSKNIKIKLNL